MFLLWLPRYSTEVKHYEGNIFEIYAFEIYAFKYMPSLFYKVLGKENFFFWEGVMTYNKVLWGVEYLFWEVFLFFTCLVKIN